MEVLSPASNSFIKSNKLDRYAPAITVFFINKREREREEGKKENWNNFFFPSVEKILWGKQEEKGREEALRVTKTAYTVRV